MLKKTLTTLFIILACLGTVIGLSFTALKSNSLLWETGALWAIPGAIGTGLIAGSIRGTIKKKSVIQDGEVTRHGIGSVISHWGTAFGIFALMASGILSGFLNVPPFFDVPSLLIMSLNIHFFGILLILFTGSFFIADYSVSRDWSRLFPTITDVVHGFIDKTFLHHPWTREGKYLSSQKVAFLGAAVVGLAMLVTGAIKVSAHIFIMDANVWAWATLLHDIFFLTMVLYVIIHVAFVVVGGHWPAFTSYFTGEISAKIAAKDYPMWYEDVKSGTETK